MLQTVTKKDKRSVTIPTVKYPDFLKFLRSNLLRDTFYYITHIMYKIFSKILKFQLILSSELELDVFIVSRKIVTR